MTSQQDKEALFREIVESSKAGIYRVCENYANSATEREDLFQEIMYQVWRSMERFENRSKWNTYIYRIAVNTAIRFSLNNKADSVLSRAISEIPLETDGSQTDEQLQLLQQSIKKLSKQDRLIISLVLEGLSYREIAGITEQKTNAVGVKINRIKKRLKKMMTHYERSY